MYLYHINMILRYYLRTGTVATEGFVPGLIHITSTVQILVTCVGTGTWQGTRSATTGSATVQVALP